jgi:hypothetical protein
MENAPKLSAENIFLSNYWIKKISVCGAIKLMARLEKKIASKVSSLTKRKKQHLPRIIQKKAPS